MKYLTIIYKFEHGYFLMSMKSNGFSVWTLPSWYRYFFIRYYKYFLKNIRSFFFLKKIYNWNDIKVPVKKTNWHISSSVSFVVWFPSSFPTSTVKVNNIKLIINTKINIYLSIKSLKKKIYVMYIHLHNNSSNINLKE